MSDDFFRKPTPGDAAAARPTLTKD